MELKIKLRPKEKMFILQAHDSPGQLSHLSPLSASLT